MNVHTHNKMENELHITLNRWLTDITDAGSFDPHKYKDDYLAITEYICCCDRETTRNALRTLRDFSLKRDCSLTMLKELITEILNLI